MTSPGLTPHEAQPAPLQQHATSAPSPRTASGLLQLPDQGEILNPEPNNTQSSLYLQSNSLQEHISVLIDVDVSSGGSTFWPV